MNTASAARTSTNPLIALFLGHQEAGRRQVVCAGFQDPSGEQVAGLELGRIQHQNFCVRAPDGLTRTPRVMISQITIENVYLAEELRGRGLLRQFVAFLLEQPGVEAVQLRAVMNKELAAHLLASPNWVCQDMPDCRGFNPSFVQFRNKAAAADAAAAGQ